MTSTKARDQISKSIDEYDEGIITKPALMEVVRLTIEELEDSILSCCDEEDLDEDVLFEADFDLDEDGEIL